MTWSEVDISNGATNTVYFQVLDAGGNVVGASALVPGGVVKYFGVSAVNQFTTPGFVSTAGAASPSTNGVVGAVNFGLPNVLGAPLLYYYEQPAYDWQTNGFAAFTQGLIDGSTLAAALLGIAAVRWAMGMVSDNDSWE